MSKETIEQKIKEIERKDFYLQMKDRWNLQDYIQHDNWMYEKQQLIKMLWLIHQGIYCFYAAVGLRATQAEFLYNLHNANFHEHIKAQHKEQLNPKIN